MGRTTLVLGLGNTLLTDEGAGVYVIRELARTQSPRDDLEFMDGGTLSFTLAGAIEDSYALIVVDTAQLDAEEGSVSVFSGEEMDHFVMTGKKTSAHEISLVDLLAIARLQGHLPAKRALVGIQPKEMDWGDAPTPEVAKAIPVACDEVMRLVGEWSCAVLEENRR